MTKRDYVRLAKALSNARPPDGETVNAKLAWFASVTSVSHALGIDNPRFNADTFLNACGATSMQGFEVSL